MPAAWLRVGLLAAALLVVADAGARPLDLSGTWYVLIHYRDGAADRPEAEQWEDRVFCFERRGAELQWTEYPIVVLEDESGRFSSSRGGPEMRSFGAWEPSPGQWAELREGPRVQERGVRSKALVGSDAEGWRTPKRSGPVSASVITYSTELRIEGLDGLPVLTQSDAMGSLRTGSLSGVTRFATTAVEDEAGVLIGIYERDAARRGSFRMTRTAPVRGLGATRPGDPRSGFQAAVNRGVADALEESVDLAALRAEATAAVAPTGALPDAARRSLEERIRPAVAAGYRSRGVDPGEQRAQVESLTRQIVVLLAAGRSPEDVLGSLADGSVRP
jgi:hypothetical protein